MADPTDRPPPLEKATPPVDAASKLDSAFDTHDMPALPAMNDHTSKVTTFPDLPVEVRIMVYEEYFRDAYLCLDPPQPPQACTFDIIEHDGRMYVNPCASSKKTLWPIHLILGDTSNKVRASIHKTITLALVQEPRDFQSSSQLLAGKVNGSGSVSHLDSIYPQVQLFRDARKVCLIFRQAGTVTAMTKLRSESNVFRDHMLLFTWQRFHLLEELRIFMDDDTTWSVPFSQPADCFVQLLYPVHNLKTINILFFEYPSEMERECEEDCAMNNKFCADSHNARRILTETLQDSIQEYMAKEAKITGSREADQNNQDYCPDKILRFELAIITKMVDRFVFEHPSWSRLSLELLNRESYLRKKLELIEHMGKMFTPNIEVLRPQATLYGAVKHLRAFRVTGEVHHNLSDVQSRHRSVLSAFMSTRKMRIKQT